MFNLTADGGWVYNPADVTLCYFKMHGLCHFLYLPAIPLSEVMIFKNILSSFNIQLIKNDAVICLLFYKCIETVKQCMIDTINHGLFYTTIEQQYTLTFIIDVKTKEGVEF